MSLMTPPNIPPADAAAPRAAYPPLSVRLGPLWIFTVLVEWGPGDSRQDDDEIELERFILIAACKVEAEEVALGAVREHCSIGGRIGWAEVVSCTRGQAAGWVDADEDGPTERSR
jgi:hypothetical protein